MTCGPTFLNGRGFSALLKHVEAAGASTVIVVSAREFAPDHLVRAVGYTMLRNYRIELLAADDPNGFIDSVFRLELVDQV
jgi:hypothetical protein